MIATTNNSIANHIIIFTEAFSFSVWVFFHEHSRFTGPQGKGEGIYLTPLYQRKEPGTFGFRAQVANHQATRPCLFLFITLLFELSIFVYTSLFRMICFALFSMKKCQHVIFFSYQRNVTQTQLK